MTGRAAGYCAGYAMPGFMNPVAGRGFWGRGAGFGGWGAGFWGRGGGRGRRNWYWATGMPGWSRASMGLPAWGGRPWGYGPYAGAYGPYGPAYRPSGPQWSPYGPGYGPYYGS